MKKKSILLVNYGIKKFPCNVLMSWFDVFEINALDAKGIILASLAHIDPGR